jgi:hypothetical protein
MWISKSPKVFSAFSRRNPTLAVAGLEFLASVDLGFLDDDKDDPDQLLVLIWPPPLSEPLTDEDDLYTLNHHL